MIVEPGTRILFGVFGLVLAGIIVECIRRGLVKEKYILLWLPFATVLMAFGLFPALLMQLSRAIHLHYITVVVLSVIAFFTGLLLYMTIRLSRLREDYKRLAQEIVLLQEKIN